MSDSESSVDAEDIYEESNKESILRTFQQLPWIEKYRPVRIESILLEDNIRNEIERIIKKNEVMNIIITGRPGIGKTTTFKCLARKLYGDYYDQYVLELNASDDRGIKIENDIELFCKSLMNVPDEEKDNFPQHKFIILDEADNITEKAQHIISKLMGSCKDRAKFAFTCNTSHNIIESIQSKCDLILRYKRVKEDKISLRIMDICDLENVVYDDEAVDYIADLCEGDMRSALNILELTYRKHKYISMDNIADVYDRPHKLLLKTMIDACIKKDYKEALIQMELLKKKGYTGTDITSGLFSTLKSKYCDDIPIKIKLELCKIIQEAAYQISKGLDTKTHVMACALEMCNLPDKMVKKYNEQLTAK
jgi:replication factor C subunit 2/4